MKEKMINNQRKSSFTGAVKINKIKKFMEENNLTEEEFAKKCKLEVVELQKVIDNYSCFEPIWLLRIARFMRVEFEDLIN